LVELNAANHFFVVEANKVMAILTAPCLAPFESLCVPHQHGHIPINRKVIEAWFDSSP
jgi:hypothetical protein